jgi:hypothetical protein
VHYVLYLPRRQSSYRGFSRVFSRAFIELCIDRAFIELLQSFSRASVELRAEPYTEPHAGVCTGD